MRASTRERPHGTLVHTITLTHTATRVANSARRASLTTQRALKRGRRTFRLTRTRTDDVHFRSPVCCASRNPCCSQVKTAHYNGTQNSSPSSTHSPIKAIDFHSAKIVYVAFFYCNPSVLNIPPIGAVY